MDTSKLYESCTITRRTVSTANGEQTYTESAVYTSIPCYVRPIKDSAIVASTTEQRGVRSVMVTIDKGYAVLVADIVTIPGGRYRVEEVKAFGLIANANVRLKCSLI